MEGELNDYFINTANYNLCFSVYILTSYWSTSNDYGVCRRRFIDSGATISSIYENLQEEEVTQLKGC